MGSRGTEAPSTLGELLRGGELSLAASDYLERDERRSGANEGADRDGRRRPEGIGHEPGLEAAKRNHSAENERPDSHDHPRISSGTMLCRTVFEAEKLNTIPKPSTSSESFDIKIPVKARARGTPKKIPIPPSAMNQAIQTNHTIL